MHQNVPDKVVAKVHDKETNMTGSQKLSENVGVARWSAIGAAVVVALSLSACGGGGGGGSSATTTPAAAVTESTVVTETSSTSTATTNATTVTFTPVIQNEEDSSVNTAAKVSLTAGGTTYTDDYTDGKYLIEVPFSSLSSTSTVVLTVTATDRKAATLNYSKSSLSAGNAYTSTIKLSKLDTVALAVPAMNPSSVYLGDGVPADKATTNQFSSTTPLALAYTVELGSMPAGVEGSYSKLVVSAQIRGLDSSSCKGNQITVFQSTSATGARAGEQVLRMGSSDVASAAPYLYEFEIPASGFKAASGKLYAEFAVDGEKCAGGQEYDDYEFAAVAATFAK